MQSDELYDPVSHTYSLRGAAFDTFIYLNLYFTDKQTNRWRDAL